MYKHIDRQIYVFIYIYRLMELMFEMQEYGQPPADIIKSLAPALQFDENGLYIYIYI